MAKQKIWIKVVTLGLAHVFGTLEVKITDKGLQVRKFFGTKTINNSRINSVDNNMLYIKVDLASGKGNEAPLMFSKLFMSGLGEVAEAIEY